MTVVQFLESIVPALESLAESDEPWEARRDAFVGQLGELGLSDHPVAAQLVERLDAVSDDERATMIASREFGIAEDPAREQAPGQPGAADGGVAESGPGYDEQAWLAYLAENGPAWDGSQDSWEQFSQWFSYYAAERGLQQPATALMALLDGQSAAERVSTFAQYGVVIGSGQQAGAQQAAEPGYDEQAWQGYLAENGPAWDGSQDSWEQFSQWFSYYAAERGLQQPATALMALLDGQSAAERVSAFAQYGVSIGQAEVDEPVPDEDIDDMMRQLLEDHPEYAEIPEEDRRELIIEAFNEASDDDS